MPHPTALSFAQVITPRVNLVVLYRPAQPGTPDLSQDCLRAELGMAGANVRGVVDAHHQFRAVALLARAARNGGTLREPGRLPPVVRLVGAKGTDSDQLEFSLPATQPEDPAERVIALDVLVSGVPVASFPLPAVPVRAWAMGCSMLSQDT